MKKKLRFGIDIRGQYTGADLYVRIFQICSILPLPYMFFSTAHRSLLTTRNLLSALFDIGISGLPRAESFALSYIFRATESETVVYFIMPVLAFIMGLAANRFIRGDRGLSIRLHKVFAALIAFDMVVRLIPMKPNMALGIPAAIAGFAIRALCLGLLVLDLRADAREGKAADEKTASAEAGGAAAEGDAR